MKIFLGLAAFLFFQNAFCSSLVEDLSKIHHVAVPSRVVLATECKRERSKTPDSLDRAVGQTAVEQEACDELLYKLTITETHLVRDKGVDPSFYETYESPPAICEKREQYKKYDRDTAFYCVFNGIREALKYELYSLFARSCMQQRVSKSEIDQQWNTLSQKCKSQKLTGDYFTCFFEQTTTSALKESFREIAKLSTQFDLLQKTCHESFPNQQKNYCMSDEYIRFKESIRNQDILKFDLNQLQENEPGFQYDVLPDYYALYNSCDLGKKKKKRFNAHPILGKKQMVHCGGQNSSGPLSNVDQALYESLCTKAETLQDNPSLDGEKSSPLNIEVNEQTVTKTLDQEILKVLKSKNLNQKKTASLKALQTDKKYKSSTVKKYLKFADKLKELNKTPEESLFEISEDYKTALNVYMQELELDEYNKKERKKDSSSPVVSQKQIKKQAEESITKKELPVREDLKKQAKDSVLSFHKGKKDRSNYAQFFSMLEADGSVSVSDQDTQSSMTQNKWKPFSEKYKKIGAKGKSFDQIKELLKEINKDFLKDYYRSGALFEDLLNGKGGNCEARMKMVLSALSDAGLNDIPGYRPVIQFYIDHVQVELYNEKEKTIIDAVTGVFRKTSDVDLYDPRVLYLGYLNATGEKNELSADDFIVLKVPDEKSSFSKASSLKTNTNLLGLFPKAKKSSDIGDPPLYSSSSEPDFSFAELGSSNSIDWSGLNERVKQDQNLREVATSISIWGAASFVDKTGETKYFFNNRKLKQSFDKLVKTTEAEDAFQQVKREGLKQYLNSWEFKRVNAFLKDPHFVHQISMAEREKVFTNMYYLLNMDITRGSFNVEYLGGFLRIPKKVSIEKDTPEEALMKVFVDLSHYLSAHSEVYFKMIEESSKKPSDDGIPYLLSEVVTSQVLQNFSTTRTASSLLQVEIEGVSGFDSSWDQKMVETFLKKVKMVSPEEDKRQRQSRFNYDYLEQDQKTFRSQSFSDQVGTGASPVSGNIPRKSVEKKPAEKSDVINLPTVDYINAASSLSFALQHKIFDSERIKKIKAQKSEKANLALHFALSKVLLHGLPTDWQYYFPSSPRKYDFRGSKIPVELAEAMYLRLKLDFSREKRSEVEKRQWYYPEAEEKYGSLWNYMLSLREQLKADGIDVGDSPVAKE